MLLPSSIQRAEDLVGIATPTVGLPWAMASRSDTVAARPASASANKVVFNLNMLHSLGFLSWGTVALDSVNRRLSFVGWPQIYGDVGSAPCKHRRANLFNYPNKLIGGVDDHEALSPGIVGRRHRPPESLVVWPCFWQSLVDGAPTLLWMQAPFI